MKREILFRGKRISEWEHGGGFGFVYGDLIHDESILWILTADGNYFEVAPETVGQFTGVLDKKGDKIFEGDIIKGDGKYVHVISYDKTKSCFTAILADYIGDEFSEPFWTSGLSKDWVNEFNKEIVGNIYDDPELLPSKN